MGGISRAITLLALCAAASASVGCLTVPTGTSLETARPASVSVARGAWLAQALVTDPSAKETVELQRSLTLNIAAYAADAKYFARVNQLPGKLRPDDVVLRFEFDRYQLRRAPHPAYFPGAILTLTLYIWFGGPIGRDTANLSGQLRIEDAAGQELVTVRDAFEDTHDVSLYSPDYAFPSSIHSRTNLVRSLLDKAVSELVRTRPQPTS
jgi:hypothetical protein